MTKTKTETESTKNSFAQSARLFLADHIFKALPILLATVFLFGFVANDFWNNKSITKLEERFKDVETINLIIYKELLKVNLKETNRIVEMIDEYHLNKSQGKKEKKDE